MTLKEISQMAIDGRIPADWDVVIKCDHYDSPIGSIHQFSEGLMVLVSGWEGSNGLLMRCAIIPAAALELAESDAR